MKTSTYTFTRLFLVLLLVAFNHQLFSQQLVKDIASDTASARPANFAVFNGKIYFAASDSAHGNELWVSDGTDTGTKRITDIRGGVDGCYPTQLCPYKGYLYFSAQENSSSFSRTLYRTDGTTAGTKKITSFWTGVSVINTDVVKVSGDYLYFNGYSTAIGSEIWVSDGTAMGTEGKDVYPFKDFNGNPLSSTPMSITDADGVLCFTGWGQSTDRDVFYLNGKTLSSRVDVNPNTGDSKAGDFTRMGNYIYFSASRTMKTSPNGPDNDEGNELWRVKIGSNTHELVKNIYPGPYQNSNPRNLFNWGDSVLFFSANDGGGVELWRTDGTEAGTVSINGVSSPTGFVGFRNKVFFVSNGRLWSTDGTLAGTVEVTANVNITSALTRINNRLYFMATDIAHGAELWESDGTANGTQFVKDVYAGSTSSLPKNLISFNNTLYFSATDSATGEELYSYLDTCNAFEAGIEYKGRKDICQGATLQLNAVAYGSAAISRTWWYNGNPLSATADSLLAAQAGSYMLVMANAKGCTDTSDIVDVKLLDTPSRTILLPNGNETCVDGNFLTMVTKTTNKAYDYQWIENGADIPNYKDTFFQTRRNSSFKVRIANGNCVIITDSVNIIAHPLPVVPAVSVDLCSGSVMVLNPGSFVSYFWNDSSTLPIKTINKAGSYSVVVTDSKGCSNTAYYGVLLRQLPTASITVSGNTFTAAHTAGNTYKWLMDGTVIPAATQSTYTATKSGNYSVIVGNQYSCFDTSEAKFVAVSVGEILSPNSVTIYPNPAENTLYILVGETVNAEITLTDITGKVIKKMSVLSEGEIEVSDLAPGIYYVMVNTAGQSQTYKVFKR